jgi:hypothetical protein
MRCLTVSAAVVLVAVGCAEPHTPTAPVTPLAPNSRLHAAVVSGGGSLIQGVCTRNTGKPVAASFEFSGADGGTATLQVTDNGVQGLNGTITLNGNEVVTHAMLGGNGPVNLSVSVTTAADNILVCELEGKPGSGLAFQVTQ